MDSVEVFRDAFTRAKKGVDEDPSLMSMELKYDVLCGSSILSGYETVWVVYFVETQYGVDQTDGCEYIYDCKDGSWVNTIMHHWIRP